MSGPSDEPQGAPTYSEYLPPPPNYPYAPTYSAYPSAYPSPEYSTPLGDVPLPPPYPGQPAYPPPPGYYPYPMMVESPTSSWAIASLVCSLANVATGFSAILGVIFGHLALAEMRRNPRVRGKGLAITGLIIGYLFLALYALIMLSFLVVLVGLGHAFPG